jgi:hypothetical protein
MKKIILLCSILLTISCSTNDDSSPNNGGDIVTSIQIISNTKLIIANNVSSANIEVRVFNQNNKLMSNESTTLFANSNPISSTIFKTGNERNYALIAKYNDIVSNSITINARENINYSQITVPVIFHIVHFGENIGSGTNLTQSQVTSLLNKLNKGFSNQYNSNNPNAVNTKVSFRLATLDSNNNQLAEPGINRINATSYDIGMSNAVDISNDQKLGPNESWKLGGDTFWNPRKYLNMWICPLQKGQSSATLARVYESNPLDGLVTVPDNCQCDAYNEFFPSCHVDTTDALNVNGTTIVHEVGHAFGLMHVFSSSNSSTSDTSDFCADSYSYVFGNPYQACSDNLGINKNDNFMDYTGTYTTFTYDQRERVQHVFRYGLWFNELKNSKQ